MKRTRVLTLLALLAMLSVSFLGCQQQLFGAGDGFHRNSIKKYYDDDSAVETRASRIRAADTGFGYPTGMFNQ